VIIQVLDWQLMPGLFLLNLALTDISWTSDAVACCGALPGVSAIGVF